MIHRYIQSIYAFTSEELGTGVSGTVRVVIDRYSMVVRVISEQQMSVMLSRRLT